MGTSHTTTTSTAADAAAAAVSFGTCAHAFTDEQDGASADAPRPGCAGREISARKMADDDSMFELSFSCLDAPSRSMQTSVRHTPRRNVEQENAFRLDGYDEEECWPATPQLEKRALESPSEPLLSPSMRVSHSPLISDSEMDVSERVMRNDAIASFPSLSDRLQRQKQPEEKEKEQLWTMESARQRLFAVAPPSKEFSARVSAVRVRAAQLATTAEPPPKIAKQATTTTEPPPPKIVKQATTTTEPPPPKIAKQTRTIPRPSRVLRPRNHTKLAMPKPVQLSYKPKGVENKNKQSNVAATNKVFLDLIDRHASKSRVGKNKSSSTSPPAPTIRRHKTSQVPKSRSRSLWSPTERRALRERERLQQQRRRQGH